LIKADFDEKKLAGGIAFNYKTAGTVDPFFMELPTEIGFPVTFQSGINYVVKVNLAMVCVCVGR
jgi:hypothetical protein